MFTKNQMEKPELKKISINYLKQKLSKKHIIAPLLCSSGNI
jgi:hypothetical protein